MLPCNGILVKDLGGGKIKVAAIDPVASMQAIDNPHLRKSGRTSSLEAAEGYRCSLRLRSLCETGG